MSRTALQRVDPHDVAPTHAPRDGHAAQPVVHGGPLTGFTPDQVDLIKRTVAEGTSDDELSLFLEVCRATGLNPFQRQIYAIVRDTWNPTTRRKEPKMTIQTGIDGYRLIASRTGQHVGTSDVTFGPEGDGGHPSWARITVYRKVAGERAEFTATARFDEYAQTNRGGDLTGLWAKMPHTMLAKCAESLALRKAFPAELSGVYTREEMAQAESEDADVVEERPQPRRRAGGRRERHPSEMLYAGPTEGEVERSRQSAAPAPAVEDAELVETPDPVDPDALAETLEERLALVDSADEATLNRWYAEARDGWPDPLRSRLLDAVKAEAARRKDGDS